MVPTLVEAQFNYSINPDLTVTITQYTGPGGDVTVPTTINGLPVAGIGRGAFEYVWNLTNVALPGSLFTIEDDAFEFCTNLANVKFGNSVTNIGAYAFYSCTSLTDLTIPGSVTAIGSEAFSSCGRLTDITISSGAIGNQAFFGCYSLTSVVMSNGVTSIGSGAFEYCSSLTNVTISASVTNAGIDAFYSCSSLLAVEVSVNNPQYSSVDGVLFDKNQITLYQYPIGKGENYYRVPDGVVAIGHGSFNGCSRLAEVSLPGSVTNIQDYAFAACTGLTNVTIPDSVTNIGAYAFYDCTSLTNVTIGKNVNLISTAAFQFTGLTSVSLPDGVRAVYSAVFFGCTNLTSAIIGKNANMFAAGVFDSCSNLTAIYFTGDASLYFGAPYIGTLPDHSIVYYVPGTLGWGTAFQGRPALPIATKIQVNDASFGVKTNQFGFSFTGSYGLTVVLEAATNLSNPIWSPLQTNTLTFNPVYFSDPQWTNYTIRFYRVRWP